MREDRRDGMTVKYEGIEVELVMTNAAETVSDENGVLKANVYASVISAFDFVLDYKNKTQFAVIDEDLGMMVVCIVRTIGTGVFIEILNVVDNDNVFIRKGLSIVRINEKGGK